MIGFVLFVFLDWFGLVWLVSCGINECASELEGHSNNNNSIIECCRPRKFKARCFSFFFPLPRGYMKTIGARLARMLWAASCVTPTVPIISAIISKLHLRVHGKAYV